MLRLIAFDFDGVLARGSNEAYLDCYHRAMVQVGVHLDPAIERQRILARWGQAVEEQVELLLQDHKEKIPEAVAHFNEARRSPAFRAQVSLFPGAEDVVKKLSVNHTLTIVSGAERALIESVLGPELLPLFTHIYSGADYSSDLQKPDPYMLLQALDKTNCQPYEAIFIGDAPNDLRMAKAAQVSSIALLTSYLTKDQALELGARVVLDDIAQVPEVIPTLS